MLPIDSLVGYRPGMERKLKCRVNNAQIEIFGMGHFDEGAIVYHDEEKARRFASWNQVTILPDDENAPPEIPKVTGQAKVDRMMRGKQALTRGDVN